MELTRDRSMERSSLLYPMMVIAAIAVIVFSLLGIATMAGWLPNGLMSRAAAATLSTQEIDTARTGVMFECAECSVIESIREFERGSGTPRQDSIALAR